MVVLTQFTVFINCSANLFLCRSKLLENRNLRLKKVKVQDEGIYICRVENSVGWQEAEARLSVHGKWSFL